MKDKEARLLAVRALEGRGYRVRDVSSGQGRPKLSIIEIERAGSKKVCSIKVANKAVNGRIHYPRGTDGSYGVLSEVDLVMHVRLMSDNTARVTMFEKATVLAALEKGYEALAAAGKEHLPIWVSPEPETGWRQAGSGFGGSALWAENVAHATPTAALVSTECVRPLSIAEAKLAVAAKYDVSPDKVEIIVRG